MKSTVFLTDYAWPDLDLERQMLEGAGYQLVSGTQHALPEEAITELAARHRPQAIMTCWAQVSASAIAQCRDLKIVARIGVGLDNIDRLAAHASGAIVTNVPDYCMEEVSDHAIALVLAWARGIVTADREVKTGRWDPAGPRLRRVRHLTVGVIGFGRIGGLIGQKLRGYGVQVLACGRQGAAAQATDGFEHVDLAALLPRSDAVIATLPLSPATRHLFDAAAFAQMKSGGLLVNVSRGGLVDNEALLAALNAGRIDMAALDVIEGEPNPPAAITAHPRVIATPHVAFSSPAAIIELRQRATDEVLRALSGQPPRNPCPPPSVAV